MIRVTSTVRTSTLLALAASALAMSAPAFAAQDDDQLPQGQLQVGKTDFTSAKAVDRLKNRLHRLAFAICVPSGDGRELLNTDQRQCIDTAIASGIAQINSRREQALGDTKVNVATTQGDSHASH